MSSEKHLRRISAAENARQMEKLAYGSQQQICLG